MEPIEEEQPFGFGHLLEWGGGGCVRIEHEIVDIEDQALPAFVRTLDEARDCRAPGDPMKYEAFVSIDELERIDLSVKPYVGGAARESECFPLMVAAIALGVSRETRHKEGFSRHTWFDGRRGAIWSTGWERMRPIEETVDNRLRPAAPSAARWGESPARGHKSHVEPPAASGAPRVPLRVAPFGFDRSPAPFEQLEAEVLSIIQGFGMSGANLRELAR